jgi:PBP1b-binding outer membrane lipoprotein LpoB
MQAKHIGWIAALTLVLAGCAQPPTADVDAAKKAIDEARQAQAAEYAQQSWTQAQDAESKLDIELDTQQRRFAAMRSYTVARQLALDTKAAADRSRDEAVAGRDQAKSEATTLMAQARDEVSKAHASVTTAPKGKGTEADLASLKSDAASIDDTLADMQKAFDDGHFNDAKVKAQSAIDAAKKIEAEIGKAKTERRSA